MPGSEVRKSGFAPIRALGTTRAAVGSDLSTTMPASDPESGTPPSTFLFLRGRALDQGPVVSVVSNQLITDCW